MKKVKDKKIVISFEYNIDLAIIELEIKMGDKTESTHFCITDIGDDYISNVLNIVKRKLNIWSQLRFIISEKNN